MTTLRDKLHATGVPIHEFRVVRVFDDDDRHIIIAYAADSSDDPSMHIIDEYSGVTRSHGEMRREVSDLNNYITAHRRLVGLDTDVFARNGIE